MSRRILVITPWAPARDGRHGSVRAIHGLLSALAERHELVVLHLEAEDAIDPELAAACVAVHALPVAPLGGFARRVVDIGALLRRRSLWAGELGVGRVGRRARELAREVRPDVVQVEHGVLGETLSAVGRDAIRIVTIRDPAVSRVEFLPLRREGLALTHRLDAWAAVREERRILSLADAAVVFSERDRSWLAQRSRLAAAELVAVPHGWEVPLKPLDASGAEPPTLLFVGNFIHPPNVAAARSLAQAILPRVQQARPDVRLEIVGASPPPELLELASDAVRVTGPVASVAPHLDRAAVVVAPLAIGGGTRVKVLEALAAGKAVVASTLAAEGLSARAGEELIVADGDAAIAAAIVRLLGDGRERRELGARARDWALRELSFSKMADRYEELYHRIEQRRSARRD